MLADVETYQIFLNGLGDFHDLNSDSKLDSNFLPKLQLDCLKTSENNMKKKLIASKECILVQWPYNRAGLKYGIYLTCWILSSKENIKINGNICIAIGSYLISYLISVNI
jgi:hypothetical protein